MWKYAHDERFIKLCLLPAFFEKQLKRLYLIEDFNIQL